MLLALVALALFLPLSLAVAGMYLACLLGLQFGIPLWLLRLQSLKKWVIVLRCAYWFAGLRMISSELRGPWDAAVPKLST